MFYVDNLICITIVEVVLLLPHFTDEETEAQGHTARTWNIWDMTWVCLTLETYGIIRMHSLIIGTYHCHQGTSRCLLLLMGYVILREE